MNLTKLVSNVLLSISHLNTFTENVYITVWLSANDKCCLFPAATLTFFKLSN